MNPIAEAMKGFTDLPIALLALLFGLLLLKKEKRDWGGLFLLVAVSGVMGAAVHIFALPQRTLQLLWLVLYVLLFEDIRRFAKLMVAYISGIAEKERRIVWITEGILYAGAAVLLFARQGRDIYLLVVFMAVMFCRIVMCLVRSGFSPAKATGLMAMLLLPILLQALAAVISFAVVLEHIVLAAAEFVAHSIGKEAELSAAADCELIAER